MPTRSPALPLDERPGVREAVPVHQPREVRLELTRDEQVHARRRCSEHVEGTGTTVMLGDWSHVPNFLFPHVASLQPAFTLPYPAAIAPKTE